MFKNFLVLAFRNFKRNKLFTLINMVGLAIGISASLVIYLIVQHQFNFDRRHPDGDRIYRIVSNIDFPDLKIKNAGVPVPTAKAVRDEVTGIETATHFLMVSIPKVSVDHAGSASPAIFRNQAVIYADEFYFKLLQYDWLAGSPQTALKDPFQVVLSKSRAESYFTDKDMNSLIGRKITYDDSIQATISGIVADPVQVTDLRFKEFISRSTMERTGLKNHWGFSEWGSINSASQLLVKLTKGTSPKQIESQLVAIREKYREKSTEANASKKDDTRNLLQPLRDIHFNDDYEAFGQAKANRKTLYGLLSVAVFLLLLGCINFINLTTAQASQRAKEIGIRKTMGSRKGQLMLQFLSETFLLTIFATILSVIISPWLLHIFKSFIPEGVSFASLNQPHVWVFLLLIIVVVSVLAGLYPALVLTKFKPVTVLKNQAYSGTSKTRKAYLRKVLTVTQFVIAQFLIIATLVVSKQIHYSLNKDLGFTREAIVTMNTPFDFYASKQDDRKFTLYNKLKAMPEIEKISLAGSAPASNGWSSTTMKSKFGDKLVETIVELKDADTAYFNLFRMKLVGGKNLEQSDTTKEFVINETYAHLMGFTNAADAVGHFVERNNHQFLVVGVITDFHTKSTHMAIKPLAFSSQAKYSSTFHLALRPKGNNGDAWKGIIAKVEKAFKQIYPDDDFNYEFFDETIAKFYTAEKDVSSLLNWAAGLCIFISCLGLLGLVIFITNTRTKEIGVRKVLGASVVQIVTLLSKDFILLVLAAFLVTLPIAWWVMHSWLEDFVYRTELSWWVFAITGVGMVLIAMLILSIRTIRSAIDNPIRALRTE